MYTEQAQTAGYNQTHICFCLYYPLTMYAGDRDAPLPLGDHSAGPRDFQPVLNNRPTVMSGNKPTFTWQSKLFSPNPSWEKISFVSFPGPPLPLPSCHSLQSGHTREVRWEKEGKEILTKVVLPKRLSDDVSISFFSDALLWFPQSSFQL